MRRSLIVAIILELGMLAPYATARTTYTLEELESMKKAGVLTGSERFVIIGSDGASSLSGGAKNTATLAPTSSSSWNERNDYDDLIAYDTVTLTRFLITMSREYYGNPDFWPYIYEENSDKLGHPDRIVPGTMVVVPRLSKFGVDPKNPADVEKAKRLGKQIYARYGKIL
ncbi:MAG: hypothetical protein K2H72_03620 [Muribaculaceae bacterium]|nr:hypothetical protein [Muribaculaceae bacterium]